MTQEEKAKRYDETIKRAKGVIEQNPLMEYLKKGIEYILPELKESEDEEIRKGLIKAFGSIGKKEWGGINVKNAIAWLEKQGEQKLAEGTFVNVDDVREDFVNEVYRVLDADSTNDRANQIIDAFDNLPTVTIKQDPCDNCKDVMLNCHNFPCIKKKAFEQGKSALEVIKEEKVDKDINVEPKFKIGDTMRTLLEAAFNITSGLPVIVSIDNEYYHCNNELIAIKDQDNYEYPPMNRRQKPVNNVEPFDKYEGLTDFERTLADICIGWIGEEPGWEQYIKDNANVLLKIAAKKFNSVQEQNPAWSEWDEDILSEIIYFFEKGIPKVQHDFRIYVSWLKSLKQRYTWKPSDKQM